MAFACNPLPIPKLRPCLRIFQPKCSASSDKIVSRRSILHTIPLLPLTLFPFKANANTRCLPPSAAEETVPKTFPEEWPYNATDFERFDESSDDLFYSAPRLVRHIDEGAVKALTEYYIRVLLPPAKDVLDICSSLESYITPSAQIGKRIVGLGMNEVELQRNPVLADFVVHDLNKDPLLPFSSASFDLVVLALSIDYLIRPRQVLADVARILRPGGKVAISFSDRVFGTKAVALWMNGGDQDHIDTVANYIHFASGFDHIQAVDLSPRKGVSCVGDPLYVVVAERNL